MATTQVKEAQLNNLDKARSMIQVLALRDEIIVHGQKFKYISNGKYSATYASIKGKEYTVIACQYDSVKNRPNALVFQLQNLKERSKSFKIFAIDGDRFFDC